MELSKVVGLKLDSSVTLQLMDTCELNAQAVFPLWSALWGGGGGKKETRNHGNIQLPSAYEKMISAKENMQPSEDAH